MIYKALDIAKHTINYCIQSQHPISNLKLQKILYYAWIDYYCSTKKELYLDDICAWQLGPVIPEVYYEFCAYAGRPITRLYNDDIITAGDKEKIDEILSKYLLVAASTLVERSHQKGKPWDLVYQNGDGLRRIIPFDIIKALECKEEC